MTEVSANISRMAEPGPYLSPLAVVAGQLPHAVARRSYRHGYRHSAPL